MCVRCVFVVFHFVTYFHTFYINFKKYIILIVKVIKKIH